MIVSTVRDYIRILRQAAVRQVLLGAVRVLRFGLRKHDVAWPPRALRPANYYYEKAIGHIQKQRAGIPDTDGLDHDLCVVANVILARMARERDEKRR